MAHQTLIFHHLLDSTAAREGVTELDFQQSQTPSLLLRSEREAHLQLQILIDSLAGTRLNYNTILQLELFCKRQGKWTEIPYVQIFF